MSEEMLRIAMALHRDLGVYNGTPGTNYPADYPLTACLPKFEMGEMVRDVGHEFKRRLTDNDLLTVKTFGDAVKLIHDKPIKVRVNTADAWKALPDKAKIEELVRDYVFLYPDAPDSGVRRATEEIMKYLHSL